MTTKRIIKARLFGIDHSNRLKSGNNLHWDLRRRNILRTQIYKLYSICHRVNEHLIHVTKKSQWKKIWRSNSASRCNLEILNQKKQIETHHYKGTNTKQQQLEEKITNVVRTFDSFIFSRIFNKKNELKKIARIYIVLMKL